MHHGTCSSETAGGPPVSHPCSICLMFMRVLVCLMARGILHLDLKRCMKKLKVITCFYLFQ